MSNKHSKKEKKESKKNDDSVITDEQTKEEEKEEEEEEEKANENDTFQNEDYNDVVMDLVIDNFGEIDRLKWENIIKEKSIVAKYNKRQTAYVKFLKTVIEFTFHRLTRKCNVQIGDDIYIWSNWNDNIHRIFSPEIIITGYSITFSRVFALSSYTKSMSDPNFPKDKNKAKKMPQLSNNQLLFISLFDDGLFLYADHLHLLGVASKQTGYANNINPYQSRIFEQIDRVFAPQIQFNKGLLEELGTLSIPDKEERDKLLTSMIPLIMNRVNIITRFESASTINWEWDTLKQFQT
jgi:hypothetical protein